nr:PREDICTED: peroxidase-like isoform X1 [Bemisia tabaci]
MLLSSRLLGFVFCALVIKCCSGNKAKPKRGSSCKTCNLCPPRIDDGFFSLRYKPQSQQLQDIADTCIKVGDCSAAKDSKYRTYDETCNNLRFPMWGVTNSALVRLLQPKYSDGVSKHRKAQDGSDLPNARLVRTTVLKDKMVKNKKVSYLFSVFAQYISHDTARTSQAAANFTSCCNGDKWPGQVPVNCTSTRIPDNDPFYKKFGVTCQGRIRSLTTDDFGCPLRPHQHVIPVTHFIDQSLIYGQNKQDMEKFKGKNGLLQVSEIDKRIFPKSNANPQAVCDIRQGDRGICFDAGDPRPNQNPPFTALVTIFVRFHNDFAKKLLKLNPKMSADDVFEETRRVMIAVEHFIVRKEWLHLLIGREFMIQAKLNYTNIDYDNNYNEFVNPSTLNEFMNGAYRGGHSTIIDKLNIHSQGKMQAMVLNDWLNRPQFAVDNFDPILKSVCTTHMPKQDIHGSFAMNNLFFRRTRPFGLDLETTSIERDREAGFAGFCDYMETLLGEPKINSWNDLKRYFTQETIGNMRKVYRHWRDVDMYVGGVAECPVGTSMFGKLFTAIIADQFKRWLLGDRHSPTFKDGPGKFTKAQLKQLNKITMSYLLCKYGDKLDHVPSKPFEINSGDLSNPFIEDDTPESTSEELTSEERLQSQSSPSENESDTSDLNSEEPDESESSDDENDDRDLELENKLESSHIDVDQAKEPSVIIRSKKVVCKDLPDIDMTPWKL